MNWTVAELLPHDHPMILLDRLLDWNPEGQVTAQVTVGPETPFLDPGKGVPAHVGLEWMAQCCGLYAGLTSKSQGGPIRMGFLLGTRRFKSSQAWFAEGDCLTVAVSLILLEDGMAVFDCRIRQADETEVASAQLTLYQPEDAGSVLATSSMA